MLDADERRFAEFAAAQLVPLRRLGFLVCGDWHLAEDAVSTVLTKLYVGWERLSQVESLGPYVRTMVVRAVIDERRRPWRRESPTDRPPADADAAGTEDGPLDRMVLRQALELMPTGRRAVLVLRFFEGLGVEETAAVLGCSAGNVKSQTSRGLDTLRHLLPDDYLVLDGRAT